MSWLYGRSMRFLSRWGGDEPATQIVLLFLLPFASYLIAEHIGVSGILAAVAAGMTITRSGVMRTAPLAMRLRANSTGRCWNLSLTAWSFCCWVCSCRTFCRHRWWRRKRILMLKPDVVYRHYPDLRRADAGTFWLAVDDAQVKPAFPEEETDGVWLVDHP